MLAQPQLHLENRATRQSTIPASLDPFRIIRMNEPTGRKNPYVCLPPLSKTNADVVERNVVGIKTFVVGSKYGNVLGHEIQHLLELHFTSAEFLLRSFALLDVEEYSVPLDDAPRFVSQRVGTK